MGIRGFRDTWGLQRCLGLRWAAATFEQPGCSPNVLQCGGSRSMSQKGRQALNRLGWPLKPIEKY